MIGARHHASSRAPGDVRRDLNDPANAVLGRVRHALLFALTLCLGGCSSLSFYWQALDGQWELSRRARPINEVIADQATPEQLRQRLRRVEQMRAFAVRELALPDNKTYRNYADLKRPFVVWNVFATQEFSVEPEEWCFPIAGCVGYRGYFREAEARAFAESLRKKGLDVFVGGVPAYSTLGYLDDPVLNTFIGYAESEVARLIFHELSHQVVYLKGDTAFNESFATAVELEGVKRWLAAAGTPEQQRAFDVAQARKHDFLALIETHKAALSALYERSLPPEEMRVEKAQVFERMRSDYAQLKVRWGGFGGYDFWFNQQPLNNAQLASLALYTQYVPGFTRMIEGTGGDMRAFYDAARKLAELPEAERAAALE